MMVGPKGVEEVWSKGGVLETQDRRLICVIYSTSPVYLHCEVQGTRIFHHSLVRPLSGSTFRLPFFTGITHRMSPTPSQTDKEASPSQVCHPHALSARRHVVPLPPPVMFGYVVFFLLAKTPGVGDTFGDSSTKRVLQCGVKAECQRCMDCATSCFLSHPICCLYGWLQHK